MNISDLEELVIGRMLADKELHPLRTAMKFDLVEVSDRTFSGKGFLTEFARCEELKLFRNGESHRWGKVGARLNFSRVDSGYLVYVDDGYVSAIEGYTYGEVWPAQIEKVELYDLRLGEA